MRIICRCLLVLVAIWTVAFGVLFVIKLSRPTPGKFISYVGANPLEGLSVADRLSVIDRAARLLNGLSFKQRQELKDAGTIRTFFAQLTPEERQRFLAMTLPEGFRQLIATLNKMDPVPRRRLAQRTLRNVREHRAYAGDFGQEGEISKLISEGLEVFHAKARPQVRADFAEVIAELKRAEDAPRPEAKLP